MSRPLRSGLLALVAIGATACDTEQPATGGTQNAVLEVSAPGATVRDYFTWAVQEDSDGVPGPDDINGDGVVDALDDTLWCRASPGSVAPSTVPWTYALKVSLLPKDQTTPVLLTSTNALGADFNRADYDNPDPEPTHVQEQFDLVVTHPAGMCSGKPIKCNPASSVNVCFNHAAGSCVAQAGTMVRTFIFPGTSRFRLSGANLRLLQASGNVVSDNCSGGGAGCTGVPIEDPVLGICPGDPVGTASLDPGNPLASGTTLAVAMEPGDTLIVEARRSNTIPGGGTVIEFLANPSLSATLTIDGAPLLGTEVEGSLESVDPVSPNFAFSYTSQ